MWYKDYRDVSPRIPVEVFSDGVLLKGDSKTTKNIRNEFPNLNIKHIPLSHPPTKEYNLSKKNFDEARKKFVVYTGNGPVAKGIDVALEVFSGIDDLELYVVGPQNKPRYEQFSKIYDVELNKTDNIHNIGWVDMMSDEYYEVVDECGYLLYPTSADTGGPPGAVVSMMWHGIIPIISEEGWSDVGDLGTKLDDCNIDTIKKTVRNASEISGDELCSLSEEVYSYARNTHSRENAYNTTKNQLNQLLDELDFYDN